MGELVPQHVAVLKRVRALLEEHFEGVVLLVALPPDASAIADDEPEKDDKGPDDDALASPLGDMAINVAGNPLLMRGLVWRAFEILFEDGAASEQE